MTRSSTTTRPGGRPTRRRTGTSVRIYGGLVEWLITLLAREFFAPWAVGFAALPAAGMLSHWAFGRSGWRWIILVAAAGYAGPLPVPFLRWRGFLTEPAGGDGPHLQWPLQLRRLMWIGLSVWTYGEAAARGVYGRWRAAISAAFALDAVAVTTVIGLLTWEGLLDDDGRLQFPIGTVNPWAGIYAVGAFLVCFTWNLRRTEAVRGDGSDDHTVQDNNTLSGIFKLDDGVPIRPTKRTVTRDKDGNPVAVAVELHHPGGTTGQIQAGVEPLASTLDLPREGHIAVPLPQSSRTRVVMMQREMLTEPQPWTLEDEHAGDYPDRPARVGVYQDGVPLEIVRFANPDPDDPANPKLGDTRKWPMNNVIIQGAPNAGKTEALLTEYARLITRKALVIWHIDLTKGGQTAVDFMPAVDWYGSSPTEAYRMIVALGTYIDWAAGVLGDAGFREWNRTAFEATGIPAILVHIEEYNSVQGILGKEIVRRSEAMRSIGGSLSVSSQRADATNMDPSLRAMLVLAWCFGLKDASDALFALSAQTIAAGADPGMWSNAHPGKCYLEASHRDPDRWAIPARTDKPIPPAAMREHVARWALRMTPLPTEWAEQTPDVGKHYLERNRTDLGQWVESHGVLIPPADQPPAREVVTVRAALPEVEVQSPLTDDEEATFTRVLDQQENQQHVDAMLDPDIADEVKAADRRRAAQTDAGAYENPLPYDLPTERSIPDLAEARDAALVEVFRRRFAAAAATDYIDASTSDLMSDWIDVGGLSVDLVGPSGPRRSALWPRLDKLRAGGHATPIGEGRRRATMWRIYRSAITEPPPTSEPDTLPDEDDEDED